MTDAYSKAAVGYERIREVLGDRAGRSRICPAPAGSAPPGQDRIRTRQLSAMSTTARCSTNVSFTHRTRTGGRAGRAPPAPVRHHHQPDSAFLRSQRPGVVKIDGMDIRRFHAASRCASRSASCCRRRVLFHGPDLAKHRLRQARCEPRAKSCAPPNWPMRANSSRRCRRVTTPWSANAA